MLDPDLGAKEMMLDKSWPLPELICSLLGAVRPRGGRKGLETVWTEEMTLELSPGRRPGVCQSDQAGKVFLVGGATVQTHGDVKQAGLFRVSG